MIRRSSFYLRPSKTRGPWRGYQGGTNLENIQIIKKPGGRLEDSYLDPGAVCALGRCRTTRRTTSDWALTVRASRVPHRLRPGQEVWPEPADAD